MSFTLHYTNEAQIEYDRLELSNDEKDVFKQLKKAVKFLKENPHYPSLKSKKFESMVNPFNSNEPVFQSYVNNNTPSAYRMYWYYGPDKDSITIFLIIKHT